MCVYDARNGRLLGMVSTAYAGNFALSGKRDELYVATTHLSRSSRGERTDVLEVHDTNNLSFKYEVVLPTKRAQALNYRGLVRPTANGKFVLVQNATPAISNAGRYAKIVQDTALLRRLIGVAGEVAELGYSEPDDVTKALDEAETKVFEIADRRVSDSAKELSELLPLTMDRLQETCERGDIITGTPTGFNDLDEILSGLQPSTLNIIGARPAMGKTALGLGMAVHVAKTTRKPVLVFSLEMGHAELTQRILGSEAEVDSQKMRTGRLSEQDWSRIGRAYARLKIPLFLDDNPRVTVMEIRARARRIKAQYGGLSMILIDYLQLMSGGASAENRQLEVSEISRGLKILARELEVPVVALSQLSRALETRADKRPMLADLRESGSLEQDADVVMFLYRDEVYNRESADKAVAELSIAKHRSGPTGVVRLVFRGQYTKFGDAARGV